MYELGKYASGLGPSWQKRFFDAVLMWFYQAKDNRLTDIEITKTEFLITGM